MSCPEVIYQRYQVLLTLKEVPGLIAYLVVIVVVHGFVLLEIVWIAFCGAVFFTRVRCYFGRDPPVYIEIFGGV